MLAGIEVVARYLLHGRKKSYIGSYEGKHHVRQMRDGKRNVWVGKYIGGSCA